MKPRKRTCSIEFLVRATAMVVVLVVAPYAPETTHSAEVEPQVGPLGLPRPPLGVLTACPTSISVSLDNLISMKEFGALPDLTSVDVTPSFNCALQYAKANGLRAIYFPRGSYFFNTPPQSIDFPITIIGDGKGITGLIRNYAASSASNGLLTFLSGSSNSSVRDLGIVADKGTSHGSAISIVASENTALGYFLFSNLYLSAWSGGNWDDTVHIDGTARTTSTVGSEPIGVRDLDFQNCSVFGAARGAMWLDGVVGFNFIGGGIIQAGGVDGTSGKVYISPSFNGTSGLPSYYININTTYVAGILMQASVHGHFSAYFPFPITTTSYDIDNIVIGHVESGGVGPGVQPNWLQSKYIDPAQ